MGNYLATHELERGELSALAEQVEVSVRTLWNWKAAAVQAVPPRPPGRPKREAELVREARWIVVRIWWRLPRGHDGWGTVKEVLDARGIEVSTALVQELVAALKERREAVHRRRIERERAHVDVQLRDVMWSVDDTQLGRDAQGAVHGVVVRETVTPKTLWVSVGAPLTGEELVRILEASAKDRGCWPLVASFDNGGANRSNVVRECLAAHGVTVLFNVPHTPEHNAFVEHAIGEAKRACGLDASTDLPVEKLPRTREDLEARLRAAMQQLEHTPRRSLEGKTPAEIDGTAARAEDHVCRARFYAEVQAAHARIAEQPLTARARRRAEREATLCSLEARGLVVRTTGGDRSSRLSKRKVFP